jgi:hypothetical protein
MLMEIVTFVLGMGRRVCTFEPETGRGWWWKSPWDDRGDLSAAGVFRCAQDDTSIKSKSKIRNWNKGKDRGGIKNKFNLPTLTRKRG